jgi:group I intron endonuclease
MDKKELKSLYKSTPRPMGVYQIRNTVNGRVLVGSSLNLDGRRNRFGFEVKNGSISNNAELKRDWEQHGAESFVFEVLDELKPVEDPHYDYRDDLAELEKMWLEQLQPYGERGYNRPPKE